MFIGEQAKLSIQAVQPHDYVLQFPLFSDSVASNLELVATLKPDTVLLDNDRLQVTNSYIVTSFDSAFIILLNTAYVFDFLSLFLSFLYII